MHPDHLQGNRGQFLAYQSKDVKKFHEEYNKLNALMTELFEWVSNMVFPFLPYLFLYLI